MTFRKQTTSSRSPRVRLPLHPHVEVCDGEPDAGQPVGDEHEDAHHEGEDEAGVLEVGIHPPNQPRQPQQARQLEQRDSGLIWSLGLVWLAMGTLVYCCLFVLLR